MPVSLSTGTAEAPDVSMAPGCIPRLALVSMVPPIPGPLIIVLIIILMWLNLVQLSAGRTAETMLVSPRLLTPLCLSRPPSSPVVLATLRANDPLPTLPTIIGMFPYVDRQVTLLFTTFVFSIVVRPGALMLPASPPVPFPIHRLPRKTLISVWVLPARVSGIKSPPLRPKVLL